MKPKKRTRKKKTTAEAPAAPTTARADIEEHAAHHSREKDTASTNTTGLEDYGRWKEMFANKKTKGEPPFRRGRIWA